MTRKKISNINDELDIKLLLRIIQKNLYFIISIFFFSFVFALLYLRWTPETYQSTAIIQIQTENQANKVFSTDNIYDENLAKQIELLTSPVFLDRAFRKLPLEVSYYAEGRIISSEFYRQTPVEIDAEVTNAFIYNKPIYMHTEGEKTYIEYPSLSGSKKAYLKDNLIITEFFTAKVNIKENLRKLQQENDNKFYFVINHPDQIINNYKKKLQVSILNEAAKTIMIQLQEGNAQKSTDIVNTIAQEFLVYDMEKKAESANKVLQYIDQQLNVFYDKLYDSERELNRFISLNNLDSNLFQPLPNIYNRINEYESQILQIESEEKILEEIHHKLSNTKKLDIYELIGLIAGSEFEGNISRFIDKLQDLLLKRESLLFEVTENSAAVKNVDYEIEIQKKLLQQSLNSLQSNLDIKKKSIQKKLDEYELDLLQSKPSGNSFEYSRLKRVYSVNEKFYNQLIEKKAEYSISKAGFVSENTILQNASVPTIPVAPVSKKIYAFALIFAIVLSVLIVFIRYLLHNKIHNAEDIQKHTEIPVLGKIPSYEKNIPNSQLVVTEQSKTVIAESLRTIRANMHFISSKNGNKTCAVTSTVSGEGKTFFAINLAAIIALANKKVIVLDLDMRKPKIHLGFGVENNHGISSILTQTDQYENCIHQSTIDNLSFITAGPIPPNPSELILNKEFEILLNKLKTLYDFIILDNPPIGIVSDALRLMPLVDFPIYILRANFSKRTFIQNINELKDMHNINNLSIVLNDVQRSGYTYGKYYAYKYTYGQNYFENDHKKSGKLHRFLKSISFFKK